MTEDAGHSPRSPRIGSQLSKILQTLQREQEKPVSRSSSRTIVTREIVVALMGATGAGKSTFIKRVTSNDSVVVGDGLQSVTQEVKSFKYEHAGKHFSIVDTPGFNDTNRSDSEILKDVSDWLLESYRGGMKISGIIYLHSIQTPRMEGSALRNLRMFQKLCGEDFLQNVILGTTFWDMVGEEKGIAHEKELLETEGFFKQMKDRGCEIVRIADDKDKCLELLSRFASKQPSVMRIQKELFEGKSIEETAASATINPELAELQQHNNRRIADKEHQIKRGVTKSELERAYSLQLGRREHETQMQQLTSQQEDLREQMAQQDAEGEVKLAVVTKIVSNQNQGYQLQLGQLKDQLRALKAASTHQDR